MFDSIAIGREGCGSVEFVDRKIECVMSAAQIAGHCVGIVEICEGRGWVRSPSLENGLGELLDFLALSWRRVGPRESIVDEAS